MCTPLKHHIPPYKLQKRYNSFEKFECAAAAGLHRLWMMARPGDTIARCASEAARALKRPGSGCVFGWSSTGCCRTGGSVAVCPNIIMLGRLGIPDFMRSVRHDARASDRTRGPPRGPSRGDSEATSQCEHGRIATAKCGPRTRKRAASRAHVPHHHQSINQVISSAYWAND